MTGTEATKGCVLEFKKLHEDAVIPAYATEGAAGLDLVAIEDCIVLEKTRRLVKTGLAVAITPGYEMQIRPRSGLALKNGVTVLNSPGTVDSDYRGEIGVVLINHGGTDFMIQKGDRIAQAVIARVEQPLIVVVDELSETVRGAGGFGSTGIVAKTDEEKVAYLDRMDSNTFPEEPS